MPFRESTVARRYLRDPWNEECVRTPREHYMHLSVWQRGRMNSSLHALCGRTPCTLDEITEKGSCKIGLECVGGDGSAH